jgi:signal transduction histidine kinase/ActR/RegA family two-component response regulator
MKVLNFAAPLLARLTIRHILLIVTAGLTLMIALMAGRDLYANAERLSRAHELRAAMATSDSLFDATGAIAIERDLALAMLQAGDAETVASLSPLLGESRTGADTAVNTALAALETETAPDLVALRAELAARHGEIRTMRASIDRALTLPRRQRERDLARRWEDASTALMTDAENLWIAFIAPYTNVDAVLSQHLRYRHLLRTITDYAGRERSIIGQVLSENAAATPQQAADLQRAQGTLSLSWRFSRLIAEQSGLFEAIEPQYTDAESHFATLHGMTQEMFYTPGVRGSYPIGPDLWFELSSQASESLTALREASRDATRGYIDGMIAQTQRAIIWQAAFALAALLLCVTSFWLILQRVIAPINSIVDALIRATRGEHVAFKTERNDEIGKLAGVLEVFQSNVEDIKRASAERDESARALMAEIEVRRGAEAKTQDQLERLSLLHQISRAIGERQDLNAIFDVAIASIESRLPADFACAFVFDRDEGNLRVARVGAASGERAKLMDMAEGAHVAIDTNGLSRCMSGRLVYEPEFAGSTFAFPQRLAGGDLKSFVAAPLQVESQVFGALIVARSQSEAFSSGECEFLRQLSEHVALAAHQAQLNAALQKAYDDLRQTQDAVMQQERLKALGQMASGIAHDINNALSPIALYTESLLSTEPALSKAGRSKLEIVQRAIDDAARTIARMSEFYRKRDRELELVAVDPSVLVGQVLDLTQARWRDMPQRRGDVIEIKTELAPSLSAIMGVESELREALTNLVFNAVDALPGGGVVTLRTKQTQAGVIEIEIQDNGVGMDEATRQRCLEPFFTTKGERGTGLGLAMVYGTVKRHGGNIEIESAPGEGTLVRMSFASVAAAQSAGAQAPSEARPRARLRLLIVDDDPILLRSLRDVLEQDGHLVTAASEGAVGVAAFEDAHAQSKTFDAVITDLGMPGFDGKRVAAAIKQASPETPVILLTGWGERLRAEEESPPHVDQILSKPPKLAEIRAALAAWCGAEIAAASARRA